MGIMPNMTKDSVIIHIEDAMEDFRMFLMFDLPINMELDSQAEAIRTFALHLAKETYRKVSVTIHFREYALGHERIIPNVIKMMHTLFNSVMNVDLLTKASINFTINVKDSSHGPILESNIKKLLTEADLIAPTKITFQGYRVE
jgi:hypothetical protein